MSDDRRDEMDELLRDLYAAEPPTSEEVAVMGRRLDQAIATSTAGPRRTVTLRPIVIALGLSAVVAGFLLVGPNPATAAFEELAAVAANSEPVVVTDAEFSYVRIRATALVATEVNEAGERLVYLLPKDTERWTSPGGRQQVEVAVGQPQFFDDADESRYYAAGLDQVDGVGSTESAAYSGVEDPASTRDWPTDSAALEELIRSLPGIAADAEVAEEILDLVRATTASPELRSAALEVLGNLDIELVTKSDEAYEFSILSVTQDPATTLVFVFDDDANLVAEQRSLAEPHPVLSLPAGTLLYDARFEGAAVVERSGQRPQD